MVEYEADFLEIRLILPNRAVRGSAIDSQIEQSFVVKYSNKAFTD